MAPINYYTTISLDASREIESLANIDKLRLLSLMSSKLSPFDLYDEIEISDETREELFGLNTNQSLGLIKALSDQCQETLISK